MTPISSKELLEKAALDFGVLPFFRNRIEGFSVEEMAAPGMLFGESSDDYGCWEWKGPVIQQQTTAYGKFFNRKAGFVSCELLPDFLNYRRDRYPVVPGSMEERILKIVTEREGITSTDLKKEIFGSARRNRKPADLIDLIDRKTSKRPSLEGALQRLQMGGHMLIADFEYKYTAQGKRYGWGVALYSTPEIWFERDFSLKECTPGESFRRLVLYMKEKMPGADARQLQYLLS